MTIRDSLRDVSQLPAYWSASAVARLAMQAHVRRLAYGPHPKQYLLLLEPEDSQPADPLPWAFYFHGGAWTFGTPEAFRPAARPWLTAGFRVLLPSYRRPPRVSLPGVVEDCRRALSFTAAFAKQTGRPVSAPHVAGISAGGHLAALTALHPDWWTDANWPAPPDRALICAAPLDLGLLTPSKLFDRYTQLNPVTRVNETAAINWLLLHGTADGMVDYRHSLHFTKALREAGHAHQLLTIPNGGHLDAGRWTYDDQDPYASAVAEFIRCR